MRRKLLVSATLAGLASAVLPGVPAASGGDALVVYSAGLDAILADDRDAALRDALRLIGERLLDLPAELEDPALQAQMPMVKLGLDAMFAPMHVRAGLLEDADPAAGPPIYAQIRFGGDAEEIDAVARSVGGMLQMFGGRSWDVPDRPGVTGYNLGGVTLLHRFDRDGLALGINELDDGDVPPPDAGLPAGVEPVFAFAFDGAAAQPLIEMGLAMMGPEAEAARAQLQAYNLLGPMASSLVLAVGHGADRSHGRWRYTNYGEIADVVPTVVRAPLERRHLAMVPDDATWAQIGRSRMSKTLEGFRAMAGPEGAAEIDEGLAELEEEIGFHLQRDLLDHMGDSYGFYMSDASGGGGLLSSVLFLEVVDEQALRVSLRGMIARLNALAMEEADGYVRVRSIRHEDVEMTCLRFPGIPIPLELSWTIAHGNFIAGATPNAVLAAVRQARGGGPSLLDNPRFREMGGDRWQTSIYVSFSDVPRVAPAGYGLATLLASALSNGVRSPNDMQRDPGVVMPPYHELLRDAKASVSMYGFDGDDLVGTMEADRSQLVAVCGVLGLLGGANAAVPAIAIGAIAPAIAEARDAGFMNLDLLDD